MEYHLSRNPHRSSGPIAGAAGPIPAAAYVRMSTERQCYSADNQLQAINLYAEERGFDVVTVYADLGKSGVSIKGRTGLQQLLRDVDEGQAGYSVLLVYDVSRWGRFPDPDEAAAYELACKRAGIDVHYCADGFENDGSVSSSILKALKRVMAGEYSRELSARVRRGQLNLVRRGFHLGGPAPFGMRRVLVDDAGNPKAPLVHGQWKALATDRVILMPGPEAELETVRRIYRMYLDERRTRSEIARILNAQKVPGGRRARWTEELVRTILTNEKYAGQNVWGRSSLSLGHGRVHLPVETWVRHQLPFPPIITPRRFKQAQAERVARACNLSDEQILAALKALAGKTGRLSRSIINEARLGFSSDLLKYRFGGQVQAYDLIGYRPDADYSSIPLYREIRSRQKAVRAEVAAHIEGMGLLCTDDPATSRLQIERSLDVLILLIRPYRLPSGAYRWKLTRRAHASADLYVLGRLHPEGGEIQDYYVLSAQDLTKKEYRLDDVNSPQLAHYRSGDLQPLFWRLAEFPSIMIGSGPTAR